MNNSPCHKPTSKLDSILESVSKALTVNTYKDTFEFAEVVDHLKISDQLVTSYDILPSFINIP